MTDRSRAELRDFLARPLPHDLLEAADAERRERFGARTSFAIVGRVDLSGAHAWCPVTGEAAPEGGFATSLDGVSDVVSDLVLLPSVATAEAMHAAWDLLPSSPPDGGDEVLPTAQLGTTDLWIGSGAALSDFEGLRVVSDGVFPRHHPVRGEESARCWEEFWRAASDAGVKGHAALFYGPAFDLDALFAQIDAIERIQSDTGVFLSVVPMILDPESFDSTRDPLLTHALDDVRALAACRLGLASVEHVSLRYARSDLKSAHTAVRGGVDDLCGPLYTELRDEKADAEAFDLSVEEMGSWLGEVGLEAHVRNGLFQPLPLRKWLEETRP